MIWQWNLEKKYSDLFLLTFGRQGLRYKQGKKSIRQENKNDAMPCCVDISNENVSTCKTKKKNAKIKQKGTNSLAKYYEYYVSPIKINYAVCMFLTILPSVLFCLYAVHETLVGYKHIYTLRMRIHILLFTCLHVVFACFLPFLNSSISSLFWYEFPVKYCY